MSKIEAYAKHFTADDSVILFDIEAEKLTKYGGSVNRTVSRLFYFKVLVLPSIQKA